MADANRNPLLDKLEKRDQLSQAEREVILNAGKRIKEYKAGEDMVRQGERPSDSILILEGFAGRYRALISGAQQITAIHLPGDFVDLHGFLLKQMDHSITTLTPCKAALVAHDVLREITEKLPHLTRLLWWSTVIDGAIHREWLTVLGRRNAKGKVAHLICEMHVRLAAVGLAEGRTFKLPLRQIDVGDMLGLSAVHVNRVIQSLRKQELITWRGDTVSVLNWEELAIVGEFEPSYLNLIFEPR